MYTARPPMMRSMDRTFMVVLTELSAIGVVQCHVRIKSFFPAGIGQLGAGAFADIALERQAYGEPQTGQVALVHMDAWHHRPNLEPLTPPCGTMADLCTSRTLRSP
jgi:hypothetical protein